MKEKFLTFLHFIVIAVAYSSFLWLDYRLVILGVAVYWLQIITFKACVLSIAQFNNRETSFVGNYLQKFFELLGLKSPSKKAFRFFLNIVLPILIILLALLFQVYLKPKTGTVKIPIVTKNQTTKSSVVQNPAVVPATKYFYPMAGYTSRIQYRWYGKYVTPADVVPYCGAAFTGYHDGDDLEATVGEQSVAVPVLATSDGTVKQVGHVSGYGGLLVLATNINGADYTVYYGHINLASMSLQAGDTVHAGDKLAELGAACSAQTDGERKHLHFAIHKGTAVDVRGYVSDLATLENWVNPKEFLASLGAK